LGNRDRLAGRHRGQVPDAGRDGGGFIVTALLGIVGAVVATFLGQALGIYAAGQSAGFIASVIGAILVLFIYNLATRGRRTVL
jgi:uncharacterized membrane protein YeaQ/YmgE (transglycosylase-associated protein family)